MRLLEQYTFINVTAKALYQLVVERQSTFACSQYFDNDVMGQIICADNIVSLNRYEGALLWVIAYYRYYQPIMPEIDASEVIMKRLNIKLDMYLPLENGNLLVKTLAEIQSDLKIALNCRNDICSKRELAEKQFMFGNVTNLTTATANKYPLLKMPSISSFPENKVLLGNRIPEMMGFYATRFDYTQRIFGGQPSATFGDGLGNLFVTRFITQCWPSNEHRQAKFSNAQRRYCARVQHLEPSWLFQPLYRSPAVRVVFGWHYWYHEC